MKHGDHPKTEDCGFGVCHRLLSRIARSSGKKSGLPALLAAFFLLSCLGSVAKAQTGAVEGRVSDPARGVYIQGAEVRAEGTSQTTLTDSTGWYRLSELPAGSAKISVAYPGFVREQREVQVEANTVSRQEFELANRRSREGEVVEMEEFAVMATREMDARTWASEEQRNAANLKRVISSDAFGDDATGNVGNFLKFFAGVNAQGDGGDEPYRVSLRGMPASSTAFTMNGNPIYNTPESGADRTFTLQEVTLANIARVEVAKSPLPSMWAEFLGGSVNLVNKSAFERTKPELTARVIVDFTGEDFSWDSMFGVSNKKEKRFNPGWEVSYINPLTDNFGFTLSAQSRKFFSNTYRMENSLSFGSGGSVAAPYLRSIDFREGARLTEQDAYSATADWRPVESLTLSFNYRWKKSDVYRLPLRTTLNAGTTPVSYSATATQGRVGAGSINKSSQLLFEDGMVAVYGMNAIYRRDDWKAELAVSKSVAEKNVTPSMGGITTISSSLPSLTIGYNGISPEFPQTITVSDATGPIDWGRLDGFRISTVEDLYRHSVTKAPTIRLDVRREFNARGVPMAVQVGAATNELKLDKIEDRHRWTYLGPDGVANNADNTAAPFLNSAYLGEPLVFGNKTPIRWIDGQAVAAHLASNPNQFVFDPPRSATTKAQSDELFEEKITAAYVQAEAKYLQSKLHLAGGVRFERTENYGEGLLNNNGTLVTRGAKVSRSYDGWFPSVNATYNFSEALQLRAAYSKTMGRPNMQHIIPNLNIQESSEQITLRNKDLKAWTAQNFDLSLAWYFGRASSLSVGVFQKNIANGFLVNQFTIDEALRQQHGLDSFYLGWSLNTTTNSPDDLELTGVEIDVQSELEELLPWAKGFSVFANLTQLSGSAANGTTEQFPAKKIANWGVSYSRGRFGLSANWTYSGKAIDSVGAFAPDGVIYIAPRSTLDANAVIRLTRHFRLFANVRNLNRQPAERYYEGSGLAGYAPGITARTDIASIRWTVGVAGEF